MSALLGVPNGQHLQCLGIGTRKHTKKHTQAGREFERRNAKKKSTVWREALYSPPRGAELAFGGTSGYTRLIVRELTDMMQVVPDILEKIVQRIVAVAQPERIILFGSAAREEMGPHSDVDVLVVKKGDFDHSRLVGDIYMNLHGVGQAVDVILVTPEQVERYRDTHCLIIAPALREGKEIYHA